MIRGEANITLAPLSREMLRLSVFIKLLFTRSRPYMVADELAATSPGIA